MPTRYWDFRTYLETMYPNFLNIFEEQHCVYPNTIDTKKAELLWNELETNLTNIDEDTIVERATKIDMGLEGGDIGVEDTLYKYFSNEYSYIKCLAKYLKQWVRTIRIRDVKKKSSLITNDSVYITFNYTAVLENVYGISPSNITHIHGSLRKYDTEPALGHGNYECIEHILSKIKEAERSFDEKLISICRALEDYYRVIYKDVNRYAIKLYWLDTKPVEEIYVVGHSLAGVDRFYFNIIDKLTNKSLTWKVYYYRLDEKEKLRNNLLDVGVDHERIKLFSSMDFFDL